jgi:Ran GTPase-activating protein (RanGAP) involved in mRNA processing and transport
MDLIHLRLDLSGNGLSKKGAALLSNVIFKRPNPIRSLDISNNGFGPKVYMIISLLSLI